MQFRVITLYRCNRAWEPQTQPQTNRTTNQQTNTQTDRGVYNTLRRGLARSVTILVITYLKSKIILQLTLSHNGNNLFKKSWIWIVIPISIKMQRFVACEKFPPLEKFRKNLLTAPWFIIKICWFRYPAMVKKFLQKFTDSDPDPDDFYKLMVTSLSKDTSLFENFHKNPISSFYVKLLTNKQINKAKKYPLRRS